MLKTIAVWVFIAFMGVAGRKVDKKKIANHNRQHDRNRRAGVERKVASVSRMPVRNVSYDTVSGVSRQVVLYSKEGKTVKVNTKLHGRQYFYA